MSKFGESVFVYCPVCNGQGVFVGLNPPWPAKERIDDPLCWDCLNCQGSGVIEKKEYHLPNIRRDKM